MTQRFDGLTKAQEDLFNRIAVGDDTAVNERTAAVLIDKGLIERYEQQDGAFTWYRYSVPVHVHIRWAQWCAGKG
jgi:membrane protease subunit (stomatin/prohibitin family)